MNASARTYLAELLGTAILVIGGVGTAVLAGDTVGTVGVALAFGLTLLALAYAIGPISGCHVNPAVTLGVALAGRLSPRDAVGYVVAQLVGGLAGAGIVYAVATGRPGYDLAVDGLGTNGWGAQSPLGFGLGAAALVEVVGTFLLVFVVLAATDRTAQTAFAGIPIGLTLVVIHLATIGVDSTSVNPARSLGSALVARGDALGQVWLFLLLPLVGAALAAGVHKGLFSGGRALPQDTSDGSASAVAADPTPTR
ncbi:aquaporin Z [Rhodococcus aerolatus]